MLKFLWKDTLTVLTAFISTEKGGVKIVLYLSILGKTQTIFIKFLT